jgi:hypothetical protein
VSECEGEFPSRDAVPLEEEEDLTKTSKSALVRRMYVNICQYHKFLAADTLSVGHTLHRNCLLKHVIEGKIEGRIEMTGRRGRRRKRLLDDLKEKGRYWKLKEEALDRTVWRTRFGRGYGPVVRQTTE